MAVDLNTIDSFGEVAAEDDEVLLRYFLATDTVKSIEKGEAFLVLGRKGAGKTAIVRHFTEGAAADRSIALNLRNYPWNVHASRIDRGADPVDAYVASWRYLVAVQAGAWALTKSGVSNSDSKRCLYEFFQANYGSANPRLVDVIRPPRLTVKGFTIAPSVFGNQLASVKLERGNQDVNLGLELEALTNAVVFSTATLMKEGRIGDLYIHFDELDAGLDRLDDYRKSMFIGLILALRSIKHDYRAMGLRVFPVLYLRTDIWDDLAFSDKNKITQGHTLHIEWDSDSLKELIEERLRAKAGGDAAWEDIADEQLMRGSQPKWNHIVARTLNRPRDVIQFLNVALKAAKRRGGSPLIFLNEDIVNSRTDYSGYFKRELDDEILPHWAYWEDTLQTLSNIGFERFNAEDFYSEYQKRRRVENPVEAAEALKILHRFSVIGYEIRSGYGGSGWAFMYNEPDRGWDAHATRFKVHPGLKEFARLREERAPL